MKDDKNSRTNLSKMMNLLYGEAEAERVYDRLEEVDPWFNQHVQQFIYDAIWTLEPLSLPEKSMVTVVCLATLNRKEQLQIHLKGCFNLGCSKEKINGLFDYLLQQGYITSTADSLRVLADTLSISKIVSEASTDSFNLSARNKALVDVACLAALGNNDTTKKYFAKTLQSEVLPEEYIRGILRQIMPYAGCPCTMNGFALLKEIQ